MRRLRLFGNRHPHAIGYDRAPHSPGVNEKNIQPCCWVGCEFRAWLPRCIALGAITAYIVERRLFRGASWLGGLASAPIVIPGIVLSVGFFAAYTQPPLRLYGTAAILIAAFTATFLPIAYAHAGTLLKGTLESHEASSTPCGNFSTMSALPWKADMRIDDHDVCFGPIPEVAHHAHPALVRQN
ncbi:MAG: hypothetical protein JO094_13445 [Hyphomicrobiales bacterium]|nr:hypothetical protein [Hyphomicrobiales bacterium]